MIAVIFEAYPADGKRETYLETAAQLRPSLSQMPGFISIERFQSLTQPEKVLSLSFWEDEASIARWRNLEMHRQAQHAGRQGIFNDYRLRIARVMRDYSLNDRQQAPTDSQLFHPSHEL